MSMIGTVENEAGGEDFPVKGSLLLLVIIIFEFRGGQLVGKKCGGLLDGRELLVLVVLLHNGFK